VTSCHLVEIYQCFQQTYCFFYPAKEGNRFLCNTGKFVPAYTALQTRGQEASENTFYGKLTHLLSQHEEIVDYMFWFAFKFLP
jgi:hypothetical protein